MDSREKLYLKLLVESVRRFLPGKPTTGAEILTSQDWGRLISFASELALSDSPAERNQAYEIVTRVMEISGGGIADVTLAAEIILARLGNFPGQKLVRKRYHRNRGSEVRYHPYLVLEAAARRVENTIEVPGGSSLPLTDFQCEFLGALSTSNAISVSAPTSAGKSFVLSVHIVQLLNERRSACVVYLVPTRALIRQVAQQISRELASAGLRRVSIRSIPAPVDISQISKGIVYVLTQERLISLLSHEDEPPPIDTVIVDEAQSVADGDRGIVLHSAVDAVLGRWPSARVVLVSPLVKNPEYLLRLFGRHDEMSRSWVDTQSTVSRNLILVRGVPKEPQRVSFHVVCSEQTALDLGQCDLGWNYNDRVFYRRARFAKAITKRTESTIIYANKPRDAEKIASHLIAGEPEPDADVIDPDILDLIDFLINHVHGSYSLIRLLRHKVAFHYGHMPAIVRSRIEELCADGKLKFICCTSTLLQGVNLPARHIVIERPYQGPWDTNGEKGFSQSCGKGWQSTARISRKCLVLAA